ncbi:D-alanyl-D-alanine carboxypeptidase [Nitrosomonas sp. Nm132]|uniref:D-alanyl-D-alanine carboxypeptidase n=1 Tax=Nitrosomonas sp. Nm132 TaxID=1881053 RepID=UPI00087E482C|nr:D-alanyl-D-alanine carboxypeptidase [Nitrosomonas sp. Nm132]SDG84481.1 D-alanyl-D-alanine carboxypeptidase [Nitrosomonas sp. Nm132]
MFDLKRAGGEGFLALAVLLLFSPVNLAQANSRHASIVIDAATGEVLHESQADASRYPASLTKMMTLYMLFDAMEQRKLTLDSRMRVSDRAASMPQTNIRLRSGDTISVREAIPALIVRSANDVAAVVAEALGGTEANFGRMMTDKARKLGMHSSTFRNASGLPNDEQKTTARDMVTLSRRLMKDFPQHYHYFSTQSFRYKGITYNSHNRMVRNTQGVDGLKTGYIRTSGFNVATSARRGNRRVIGVVMGGQTAAARDQHMAQLLDRSFTRVPATQLASNTGHADAMPAVAMKVSTLAPVPKPAPLLEKAPTPVMMQQATQTETRVELQRVALVSNSSWGVQIGSYLTRDRAQAQAQVATRWVSGEVVINEVEISNRKLYRARLLGLQESQARTACQNLSRQGIECVVVRTHG